MWIEVVRRKWRDPLSSLRREWFELSLIKEIYILGFQKQTPILDDRRTLPMPAEKERV